MAHIAAYGAYIPYWRLSRQAIGASLGTPPGKGTRAVASFDEDSTSMGVEAARAALGAAPAGVKPGVIFVTTEPAYLDKTNATAIHAALDLPSDTFAYDMIGSTRSAWGALSMASFLPTPTLVVLSDTRSGLPGGGDESEGGDAAIAFLLGGGEPILEVLGTAHATGEFLDRWRIPGDAASRRWEERFGEFAYLPLAEQALTDAFKSTGLGPDGIDHLIVAGPHGRAVRRIAGSVGAPPADDLTASLGFTGVAHAGLMLANVLDSAGPGQTIAVVSVSDGVDVTIMRTTDAIADFQPKSTVADLAATGAGDLPYTSFLTWRGHLRREPPRRPDPIRPAAPPSMRSEDWKYGFTGSRCDACGTRHLPPQRVCVKCQAIDQMSPERLADVPATVATFTIDRLAYSLSPPVVAGVLDFDGGGRFQCEITDVDPGSVAIGDRVEMTFRRLFTAEGVHNYFWKARPIRGV